MTKLRWGILSTAKIGTEKVIPAMQSSQYCDIVAIASRNLEKAKKAANRLGIPQAFGSYEELLASNDFDAVYNPLHNHLHVPWSIQALRAGKHVLCEKPIELSVAEAQQLLAEAQKHPRLKIMEAFMYRHHPHWQRTKQLVNEGEIGELRTIHSFFSYYNIDPGNIRNMADIGGSGLMDIGYYCISLVRFIFGEEPHCVFGMMKYDSEFKKEIVFDICDQYTIQGDLFSLAVLNDTEVPTPLEDAVANMQIIEAIIESEKRGTWVRGMTR